MLCDAQLLKTKRESKTSQDSESSSRNGRDWEDMTLSSSSLGVLYCKVPNRILADAFLLLSARLPVVATIGNSFHSYMVPAFHTAITATGKDEADKSCQVVQLQ